jgi:AcrR family transcriptional regulator
MNRLSDRSEWGMEPLQRDLTVSELSKRSGVPLPTIKFYIREGLLPGPRKARGTRAHYTARHLHRLELVKKIQSEGNMPLAKIREILSMIDEGEKKTPATRVADRETARNEIITAAISVFRNKGYEKATIADIVDAARIVRSTFYSNFQNKKELFIESIKQIMLREMDQGPPGGPEEVHGEQEILEVFDRHAMAYYNANPLWIDMVDLLRTEASKDPEGFSEKLDEVVRLKIRLLKKGIEKGIRKGLFRRVNATIVAVMLLGLQDYHGSIGKEDDGGSPRKRYEEVKDVLLYGILKRSSTQEKR